MKDPPDPNDEVDRSPASRGRNVIVAMTVTLPPEAWLVIIGVAALLIYRFLIH